MWIWEDFDCTFVNKVLNTGTNLQLVGLSTSICYLLNNQLNEMQTTFLHFLFKHLTIK